MATGKEEPPLRFPEDFPPDKRFLSPLDFVEPKVNVGSPFDNLSNNFFRRAAAYIASTIRDRPWNIRFFRFPPPLPPREYVTRIEYVEFKRRMDAYIRFLKDQQVRQESEIRKMKKGVVFQTQEQAKLKKFLEEMADDIKKKFAEADAYMKGTPEKAEELRKLLDELTKRISTMEPGKSRFRITDFEGLITLRQRLKTVYQEMAYYTGLVAVLLQVTGYLHPKEADGPRPYEAIEKKSNEILNEDYSFGLNLHGHSIFQNGLAMSTGFKIENGLPTSSIFMRFMKDKFSAQVTSNLQDTVVGKVSLDEVWGPDMKLLLHMGLPYNAKAEIKSLHKYGAFRASLGLNMNPVAYVSASVGTKEFAVGGFCEVDTVPRIIRRYSAGVTLCDDIMSAKISWNKLNNVDTSVLKSSIHCGVLDTTSVVTEYVRNFTTGAQQLTYGLEHSVDEYLTVKARISHDGTIAAMLKQRLSGNAMLAMSTEFNYRVPQPAPRFGLSFSDGS